MYQKYILSTPWNEANFKVGCIDHTFLRGQHNASTRPKHTTNSATVVATISTIVRCDRSIVGSFDSTTSSTSSLLGCSQWVVVVIRIETGTETGKHDSMPRFSKRVLFLRHLNGLLNHRLKHRLCCLSADDDDDSVEEAKDAALASIIKHCEMAPTLQLTTSSEFW